MGIKLKIASKRFKRQIMLNKAKRAAGKGKNLRIKPKNKATKILAPGPAIATLALSHLGFLKL